MNVERSMAHPASESVVVRTKFIRLNRPAALRDQIDGWTVCWLGGWDKGKVFFLVMVKLVIGKEVFSAPEEDTSAEGNPES